MKKMLAGMLVFGSIWGLLECSLGDWLHDYTLTSLMVVVAVFLMAFTRRIFAQPGMQAGMALIAATLRYLNPIGGACLLCASIAILVQGLVFEAIWKIPWLKYQSTLMRVSMGVISFFSIASISYLATQILTPVLTATFYLSDLSGVLPKIFAHSLIAGLAGSVVLPATFLDVRVHIKEALYYPVAIAIVTVSWIASISGI